MNLVVGATGLLGSEICRLLAEDGQTTSALVRASSDKGKVESLERMGASIVQGDLKDSRSLEAACKGVSAVISTASSTLSRQEGDSIQTVDRDGQIRLIDAAKSAGVERLVFVSFRENPELQYPLTVAKREVERYLRQSGLRYTSVQSGYFMEVWLSPALGFDFNNAQVKIYGSGRNKLSWISFVDVAKFTVACLDNPAADNAILEVGGPEALSPLQVVEIFEKQSKRKFSVEHVPEEALKSQKAAATDPLEESFAGLMLQYASGDIIDMTETLKAFPLQLTTVEMYAERVLANN